MKFRLAILGLALLPFSLDIFANNLLSAEPPVVKVWPNSAPGVVKELTPRVQDREAPPTVAGAPIHLLTDISSPELVYFRANGHRTTPTILICPGGGHSVLAYDLEGTELAHWLNKLQINAVVLKYRVPSTNEDFRGLPAVQDAQRAMRVIRSKAEEWGIDANRLGIMGFSAGGEVAARVALQSHIQHYDRSDAVDDIDCRPNFAMLIYPAYLTEGNELKADIDPTKHPEPAKLPPFFLVHTWDDPVTPMSSLCLAKALRQVDRPCELHLFDRGGHGYGIRHVDQVPVTDWINQADKWLKLQIKASQ